MRKVYEYQNGTIYVKLQKSCDREALKKVTEDFLKKVISEETKNGNSNTSKNFTKEQILH